MEPELTCYEVANHWPYLKRQLSALPCAHVRALELVAVGQVDAGGEAVAVRARALAAGYSPGEAGRLGVVLRELEARGAVWRYPGRGRRPSLWSLRADLSRWRGVGWENSAEAACQVLRGCVCRAAGAFVARFPGQSPWDSAERVKFDLLSRDHIRPPGVFLVETRDRCEDRATNANPRAYEVVETRDKPPSSSRLSSLSREQLFSEATRERFEKLKRAAEAVTSQELYGRDPRQKLLELADRITDDQASLMAAELRRLPGHHFIPAVVDELADLSTTPAVKRAGRAEAWQDGPAPAAFPA